MIQCICQELVLRKKFLDGTMVESIYFGGGTPSLLNIEELELIIGTIYKHYSVHPFPEITLEANPDDINQRFIKELYLLNVNRLSIGIQTFHDAFLKFMNRAHNAREAEQAVRIAREAGFSRLSTDLIYGIPHPDHSIFEQDLEKMVALNTDHISAYCLTIEERTVFGKWRRDGRLVPPQEDFAAEQFEMLMEFMPERQFEQYEISNFARDQKYSIHNTNYWKGIRYLGVGPGAHSFNTVQRQYNISNNRQYIDNIRKEVIPATIEELTEADRFNETLLTGLRTIWGVDTSPLSETYPLFFDSIKPQLERLSENGLLVWTDHRVTLTRSGKLLADEITARLLII